LILIAEAPEKPDIGALPTTDAANQLQFLYSKSKGDLYNPI
jgi:hypothetical protein